MSIVTITQLALDLHTDLANIKVYRETSPAVTRALIAEAFAKLSALTDHLESVQASMVAAQAPAPAVWQDVAASLA